MYRILIPVDPADPAGMQAAIAEAIRLHAQSPVRVHLLSVQPVLNGHVAMFFDEAELQQLQEAAGEDELAPARALLARSELPVSASVRVGRRAETIARAARELRCSRVLMGRADGGNLAGRLFGSLVQQVHLLLGAGSSCQVTAC